MRQCASAADEHVCNHLGRLGASVGAGQLRMLRGTELSDVFALVQRNAAALVLGAPRGAIGARLP
eukprot:4780238-Pyramimonas_sp.AAC.1